MTLQSSNVRVAFTGHAYKAPTGTTAPASTTDVLDVALVDLGYLSEDGIGEQPDITTSDIKAMQGGVIVRKVQTGFSDQFSFTMIETKLETVAAYFGNAEGTDTEFTSVTTADQLGHYLWVFDIVDDDWNIRAVVPDGQIVDRGEVSMVNENAISYPVTVTAYPDDTGVLVYRYYAQDGGS